MPAPARSPATLVVSCYELGHQPLAAASLLGFLRAAGNDAVALDLAVEQLDLANSGIDSGTLRLVAISVPMHTALHIGVRVAARIRELAPRAHICFFGHYAALNADYLLEHCADSAVGGEAETTIVALADALARGEALETIEGLSAGRRRALPVLERLAFARPARDGLPGLESYARLAAGGETRLAAAVETTRGCRHHCRHCPIPAVYDGRFFVVPREVVLDDIRTVVAGGARHITFADADFFNGPGHVLPIIRAMHAEFPDLTFDVTTKIENLLKHRDTLGELAGCGCLFIVSAVESLSEQVLQHLLKGHTRGDVDLALQLVREAGIVLRPSLVAFTPWTTIDDYVDVLDWIARESLVDHVDPVQFSIRLLVPPGSGLLETEALQPHLRGLDAARFAHTWEHPDPRMDRLHTEVSALVQTTASADAPQHETFRRIRDAAYATAGRTPPPTRHLPARAVAAPPRITEPWFC